MIDRKVRNHRFRAFKKVIRMTIVQRVHFAIYFHKMLPPFQFLLKCNPGVNSNSLQISQNCHGNRSKIFWSFWYLYSNFRTQWGCRTVNLRYLFQFYLKWVNSVEFFRLKVLSKPEIFSIWGENTADWLYAGHLITYQFSDMAKKCFLFEYIFCLLCLEKLKLSISTFLIYNFFLHHSMLVSLKI